MFFTHIKTLARNKYFSFIQFYMQVYGSSGFKKCKDCKGTGLSGVEEMTIEAIRNHSWTGEFCSKCDGKGYLIKPELINNTPFFTTCDDCKGEGFNKKGLCKKCDGVGFLDWVSNITGSFSLSDLQREIKNK
jgi:DnaJ-class molecular chaperone